MDSHFNYKCPMCGKQFYVPYQKEWVYQTQWKYENLIMCSWTCFRNMNILLFNNPDGKVTDYDKIYEYTKKSKRKHRHGKK